ncbi:MAG: DUF86 domain-containing protein [Candidatus Aenigmatarchaeota archaeon]
MTEKLLLYFKELIKNLEKWKEYEKIKEEEFLTNEDYQNMVMHCMLRAIQTSIDIGNEIIRMKKFREPSSYKDVFEVLYEKKIIGKNLKEELKFLASFRNVLVHLYLEIDLKKVYKTLKTKREVLEEFAKIVKKFIEESSN